jgi:hypothetical protein
MLRKHRADMLADGTRPHRAVITNLLAMQARLRGDLVLPVHPSARFLPAGSPDATSAPDVPEVADDLLAEVIDLPGAAATPVRNPGVDDDVRRALTRLAELEDRLEGLQDDLLALGDRLEPAGASGGLRRGTPEDAIVRLQRLIDRRLGSS